MRVLLAALNCPKGDVAGNLAAATDTVPALFAVGGAAFGVAICAEGGVDYPFDEPAAAGAGIVFFCAAPGLHGPRRTDEAAWRAGFDWWESCGLADARRRTPTRSGPRSRPAARP
jgi:predicted amidohydrolase